MCANRAENSTFRTRIDLSMQWDECVVSASRSQVTLTNELSSGLRSKFGGHREAATAKKEGA
jgi:hypothetical protein